MSCVTQVSHKDLGHCLLRCPLPSGIIGRETRGYIGQSFGDINGF